MARRNHESRGSASGLRNELVKKAAALALVGAAALSLSGCGETANANQGDAPSSTSAPIDTPTPDDTATPEATATATPEASDWGEYAAERQEYEAFLASLTPAQKAAHDQMSATNLEKLTDEQITAIARIPLEEVSDGNGGIDMTLYAQSLAARMDTLMAGCTENTFAQYGRALDIGIKDAEEINARYTNAIANGLIGTNGTPNPSSIFRCTSTEAAIDLGVDLEPYDAFSYLEPGSIQVSGATVNFVIVSVNNYNRKELEDAGLVEGSGQASNLNKETIHVEYPFVDDDGYVLPSSTLAF